MFRFSFDCSPWNRHCFPLRPTASATHRRTKTCQVLAVLAAAAWACWVPTGQRLSGAQAPPPPTHPMPDSATEPLTGASQDTADADTQQGAQRAVQWGRDALLALDPSSARLHFRRALELDPTSPWPHLGLMSVHLALQDPQSAQHHVRRAETLASAQSLSHRQQLSLDLGALQTAAALAWKGGSRGRHRDLLAFIETAIERYPADPDLYILRGRLSATPMHRGRQVDGAAIPWYRRALELEPDSAAAHHFLVYPLRAQGRSQAARRHAERFADLQDSPAASRLVVKLLLEQGEPRLALQRLLRAHERHHDGHRQVRSAQLGASESGSGGGPRENLWVAAQQRPLWGEATAWAEDLRWLVAVEAGLGLPQAEQHASELMGFEVDGRLAGFNCLPLLRYLQNQGRHRELLLQSRQCEAKDSLLAAVIGAAYRGEAELALGRPTAAQQALAAAQAAHRRLLADLQVEADERPFAQAAEVCVDLLQGKLELLVGDLEAGERRLLALVQRLSRQQDAEAWLRGSQALQDIGTLANHAGRFKLSIATSRALGRMNPPGLGDPPQHLDAADLPAARSWRPLASSWVVWTDH